MKTFSTYIRAFFSLGRLGWVIAFMALAMSLAAYSQDSESFDAIIERTFVLGDLEALVALELTEMQVQEIQEIFTMAYGLPATDALERVQQADENITSIMAQLDEEGAFDGDDAYIRDLTEDVNAFNEARDRHAELFSTILNSFDEADEESLLVLVGELEADNENLQNILQKIIIDVEQGRQSALAEFPAESNISILILVVTLAVILLLALVGYQSVASAVRPISHLRNKIALIAGDVYRPGASLIHGAAGNLSKALEELASAEQIRNQTAKQEIEDLRQALYESRRRRLKIYQPGKRVE